MKTHPQKRSLGFTLIEMMISIVVLAVLARIALPSFQQMLRNAEIRTASESLVNGMQRARAEAVARSGNVRFTLVTSTSTSWSVVYVPDGSTVDSRASTEGSTTATAVVSPLLATSVTFNNLGQVVANADTTATLTQVTVNATGGTRSLRVTIGAGGNAKYCDPGLATGSTARAC